MNHAFVTLPGKIASDEVDVEIGCHTFSLTKTRSECVTLAGMRRIDPKDILGRRFDALIVEVFLREEPYSYGNLGRVRRDYIYRCVCDCGTKDVETTRVLLLSRHKTSCGCQWKPKAALSPRWTGHVEISGVLWSSIRNHASYRDLVFEITIEDAWAQFVTQNRKCALTGVPIYFAASAKADRTASLDRTDSLKGYVKGNIQWVHKDIQRMKWDLSQTRFVELCRAVVVHNGGR